MAYVALFANLGSAGLLIRYRHRDINMRAMWLCTRNDAIGNAATVGTGVLVLVFGVPWPDWLHDYNWHRPHASLQHKPPISRLRLPVNNVVGLHT